MILPSYKTCTKENDKGIISESMYQMFHKIYDICWPAWDSDNAKLWGSEHKGGLSYYRIELLEEIRKCNNAIISRIDEGGVKHQSAMKRKKLLEDKISRAKRERIRLIASGVADLSEQYSCKGICIENLDLQTNGNSSRHMNRLLSTWCPKGVIQQLVQKFSKGKTTCVKVNPYNSSHYDWVTDVWKPRLFKVTGEDLQSNFWTSYFKRNLKLYNKGNVKGYAGAVHDFFEENGLTNIGDLVKLKDRESLYVPRNSGHYYQSEAQEKPMLADQSAALCICVRGIRQMCKFW